MKIPFAISVSLLSINITLPPRQVSVDTPSLHNRVTQSLRDAVTRSRGAVRRANARAKHCVLRAALAGKTFAVKRQLLRNMLKESSNVGA